MIERATDWIQTASGRQFWPLEPRADDIHLNDIAHALALKCRFAGHTREFYSVAQHSVYVSMIVPPEDALWGLLHDAAEAYLPDVCRPIKKQLIGYAAMESRLLRCVAQRFGLPIAMPQTVKEADLVMLATEQRDVMGPAPAVWQSLVGVEPWSMRIDPWTPMMAKGMFLQRFSELQP